MFISKPSYQARFSNWAHSPGAIYWEAIEVGLNQIWFVVNVGHYKKRKVKGVVRVEREGSTTMLMASTEQVTSMINNPSENDKVDSVMAMVPPILNRISSDLCMQKAIAIWRYEDTSDGGGGIPYDVIEVEGGDLVPSFPLGQSIDRSNLTLVVQLPMGVKQ